MSRNVSAVRALFEKQNAYFATDATKPYDWRIDQLHRLSRMLSENEKRFSDAAKSDFKTALQEHVFEVAASIGSIEATKQQLEAWMEPVDALIPKFLTASGHKGIVYREPYGVTLIICPFNGLCSFRCVRRATGSTTGQGREVKADPLRPGTTDPPGYFARLPPPTWP